MQKAPDTTTISPASMTDGGWLGDWCRTHPPLATTRPADAIRTQRRLDALMRCVADGCTLLATGHDRVQGLAALDLDRALIIELGFASTQAGDRLVGVLLAAIERLAVRFGLDELRLPLPAAACGPYVRLGYRHDGDAAPGAGFTLLRRSLARRQTRFSRRIRGICADLGIPADYGRLHRLPMQPQARRLVTIGADVFGREQSLTPRAANAWRALVQAAARDGIVLQAVSAYRSVDYQRRLVENKLARGLAIDQILEVSAAPGFSEHHTGNAVDVTTPGDEPLENSFERTAAFAWLSRHASQHGFRLSFPRANRHGIAYEPWHWCFMG